MFFLPSNTGTVYVSIGRASSQLYFSLSLPVSSVGMLLLVKEASERPCTRLLIVVGGNYAINLELLLIDRKRQCVQLDHYLHFRFILIFTFIFFSACQVWHFGPAGVLMRCAEWDTIIPASLYL